MIYYAYSKKSPFKYNISILGGRGSKAMIILLMGKTCLHNNCTLPKHFRGGIQVQCPSTITRHLVISKVQVQCPRFMCQLELLTHHHQSQTQCKQYLSCYTFNGGFHLSTAITMPTTTTTTTTTTTSSHLVLTQF